MLQNRVDPFGNLIRTEARGSWMGTRGILHNEKQEVIRPFKLKTWITCKLEFKERKRQVMAPKRYTELFFLDEATSFAAGHRPCCECRRKDFNDFKYFWLQGNREYHFDQKTHIEKIDQILHRERIGEDGSKIIFEENRNDIPDGSFVLFNSKPFLVFNKLIFSWSPFGYEAGIPLPAIIKLAVLTPKSILNAFRAGYKPQVAVPGSFYNFE